MAAVPNPAGVGSPGFVDYFLMMKRAELARYDAAGADAEDEERSTAARREWQMREYFEFF